MIKKRFIAGAVCPKCAAMDRLVMFEENGVTVRECVECGFSDTQKDLEHQKELVTRVNQMQETELSEDDVQPVKILH